MAIGSDTAAEAPRLRRSLDQRAKALRRDGSAAVSDPIAKSAHSAALPIASRRGNAARRFAERDGAPRQQHGRGDTLGESSSETGPLLQEGGRGAGATRFGQARPDS